MFSLSAIASLAILIIGISAYFYGSVAEREHYSVDFGSGPTFGPKRSRMVVRGLGVGACIGVVFPIGFSVVGESLWSGLDRTFLAILAVLITIGVRHWDSLEKNRTREQMLERLRRLFQLSVIGGLLLAGALSCQIIAK